MLLPFYCYFLLDSKVNIDELRRITRESILLYSNALFMKCVYILLFCKYMYLLPPVNGQEKLYLETLNYFYRYGYGRVL